MQVAPNSVLVRCHPWVREGAQHPEDNSWHGWVYKFLITYNQETDTESIIIIID